MNNKIYSLLLAVTVHADDADEICVRHRLFWHTSEFAFEHLGRDSVAA
jgi:hypothetical protein